jgi:hypothetical protein
MSARMTFRARFTSLFTARPNAAGDALYGGTSVAQNFKVLYGDFNGDGVVSAADLDCARGEVRFDSGSIPRARIFREALA